MVETIALGVCGGLIAGISRDVAKWYIKRRAGNQSSINILMLDKKHLKEMPSLYSDQGWAEFVADLNEKNKGN